MAAVAVGHGAQGGAAVGCYRQGPAGVLLGADQETVEGRVVQSAQDHDLAARQDRGVQLEGRVLGGGPDQDDRAVLHIRKEAILLGAVEAVDLVDEQEGALPHLPALGRGFEDLAQVGDA